jgi:hypothetical protein
MLLAVSEMDAFAETSVSSLLLPSAGGVLLFPSRLFSSLQLLLLRSREITGEDHCCGEIVLGMFWFASEANST